MIHIDATHAKMPRLIEVAILNRSEANAERKAYKPGTKEFDLCDSLARAWSSVEHLARQHRPHAEAYVDPEWMSEIASAANITVSDLGTGKMYYHRTTRESDARSMIAWFLCRYERGPKLSMPNAAKTMGMRSHASVHGALARLDLVDKGKFDEFKKRLSVDEVL